MRSVSLLSVVSVMLLSASIPASASPHVRRGPTAPRLFKGHAPKNVFKPAITRAGIAPERATELQTALIKAGYLSGTPSGTWDAASQAAMEKLQADNGWQTKLVPDSRAIIKLGLGPNSGGALESSAPHVDFAADAAVHATNP